MEGPGMSKQKPQVKRVIESHRQCPICWDRSKGYGVAYSTQGPVRYYKCCKADVADASGCGHTWTAIVKVEVVRVEHRTVTTESRRLPD